MNEIKFESFIDLLNKYNNSNHNALEYVKIENNNNYDEENESLSFKNLNKLSNFLSNHLLNSNNNNNKKPIIIGVYQNHSFQLIISIISIFKLNLIYLPLDISYPIDRLSYMLNHSDCNIIITTHQYHREEPIFKDKNIICIDCLFKSEIINNNLLNKFEKEEKDGLLSYKIPNVNKNDPAYLVYTSGSTGNPKGVLCSHSGIPSFLNHQIKAFKFKSKHTRLLQSLPICFDASLSEIGTSLLGECTLLIPKTSTDAQLIRGSSISFLNHVTLNNITAAMVSPSFLSLLSINTFNPDISPLETIVIGGEKCPIQVLKQWRKKLNIINVYGPTETTVCTTTNLIYKQQDHDDDIELLSLGEVVPGLSIYLLDQETGLPIKMINGEGEIYISGEGVAIEYYKNQSQTHESFKLDPFKNDGSRMFKTGDWGKLIKIDSNGKESIEFRGRIDNQIKLHGSRIELDEISKTLENHHLVHQAICDVKNLNTNDKALIAYLILKDIPLSCKINNNQELEIVKTISTNSNLLSNILKQFLLKSLPTYMIPQYFIIMKSFPLNKNEKIDKFQLPIPILNETNEENSIKSNLLNIVKQVLMNDLIESDQDLILNYGMTSIQCMQIIGLARSKFGIILTVFYIYNLKSIDNIVLELENPTNNTGDDLKSISNLKSFLSNFTINNNQNSVIETRTKFPSSSCKGILITGVTGFIGYNIFKSLIKDLSFNDYKFYLLVRNVEKLKQILNSVDSRIIILKGDIGKIKFGLNEIDYQNLCNQNVSMIIHCAAKVDMNLPLDEMIQDNIKSMYYLLDFINEINIEKIHYISTLSTILSNSKYWLSIDTKSTTTATINDLNQPIENDKEDEFIFGGYAQSKWLSEFIISNSNLGNKLIIHRPAMICPNIPDEIQYSNYLNKLFSTCRQLGCYPLFPESIKTDITPINQFINQFIINLKSNNTLITIATTTGDNVTKYYSYFTPNSKSLLSLFKLEFGIENGVDSKSWSNNLNSNHSFYPFIQFLNHDLSSFERVLFPGNKLPIADNEHADIVNFKI